MKKKNLKYVLIVLAVVVLSFQGYYLKTYLDILGMEKDYLNFSARVFNDCRIFYSEELENRIYNESVDVALGLNSVRIEREIHNLKEGNYENAKHIQRKQVGFMYIWHAALAREKCDKKLFEKSIGYAKTYFGKGHGLNSKEDIHSFLDMFSSKRRSAKKYCNELK